MRKQRSERLRSSTMSKMTNLSETSGVLLYILVISYLFHHSVSTPEEGQTLLKMMEKWQPKFPTWIPGGDPCGGWENITCTDGHVTALNISFRGISGDLAPAIGQLKELIVLDFSDNDLHGNLPDSLESCDKLRFLNLSSNSWNTSFPKVLLKLTNLEDLRLGGAGLSGAVPKKLYDLSQLRILYLNNNPGLKADLKDFSLLENLEELSLWNVRFFAQIPEELGTLKNLRYFNCHDCELVGGLPQSFGGLKALENIQLQKNTLTGNIPDSWKALTTMRSLRIDSNFFFGSFPDWVFSVMPQLNFLYLSQNMFYGRPPSISFLEREFNLSGRFDTMRWDCNYLQGPTPCLDSNVCSNATIVKKGLGQSNSSFAFAKNCYDDASGKDISSVTNCGEHSLTCEKFQTQILNQQICPDCPTGQVLQPGVPVNSGCVCELKSVSGSGSNFPVGPVVGGLVGLAFVVAVIFLGVVVWKRGKRFSFKDIFGFKDEADEDEEWTAPAGVQRFTIEELARITSDFSTAHVIGVGGFGRVYHGNLDDGREVAIKRAFEGSSQGLREFRNEITLLSRLHHRHLVRLEGFCAEKDFKVLVYEFLKRGNLGDRLYGEKARLGTPLTSYKRVEIAYGVAQGLEYLHSFADPPVIHRDIKPSNILLDEQLVAKVADFGISKESAEENTHISTRPAGTPGFVDPEYFLSRQLSTASDVYAYGVVLLEMITGQMAIDTKRKDEFNIIPWVKKRFLTAGIVSIIDPTIENDYSADAFTALTQLALRCADFSKSERPSMKEVLTVLELIIAPKTPNTSTAQETDWLGQGLTNISMSMDSESGTYSQMTQGSTGSFMVVATEMGPR